MKSLKQIYVEYEIGEIYPENLPKVLIDVLNPTNQNEFLIKISDLKKPTRADIYELLYSAFEIPEKEKLTKQEKLDLLINKWLNNKVDSKTLHDRIKYFELAESFSSKNFDEFMKNLDMEAGGNWVPGDEWDWAIENLKKDFRIENRYSEFLIKTSC